RQCPNFYIILTVFLMHTTTPVTYTLSLHDALPILSEEVAGWTDRHGRDLPLHSATVGTVPVARAIHGAELADSRDRTRVLHPRQDRKSTRLNSSHVSSSYAVFCLKKKNTDTVDEEG